MDRLDVARWAAGGVGLAGPASRRHEQHTTSSTQPIARIFWSRSQGGNINLWSTETGEKQQTLAANGKFLMSVAFSPDGSKVAAGSADGAVTVFDVSTHKLLHKLEGHALSVRALAFSKDSTTLFSGSDDAHINMFDVNAGALVRCGCARGRDT